jgi:hypothetical protein
MAQIYEIPVETPDEWKGSASRQMSRRWPTNIETAQLRKRRRRSNGRQNTPTRSGRRANANLIREYFGIRIPSSAVHLSFPGNLGHILEREKMSDRTESQHCNGESGNPSDHKGNYTPFRLGASANPPTRENLTPDSNVTSVRKRLTMAETPFVKLFNTVTSVRKSRQQT